MAQVLKWVLEHHSNPAGPSHPLIWSPDDPECRVSYYALLKGLSEAWEEAFGVPKPKGVGFHVLCRAVVTTIVDQMGTQAAAEFTGRTEETIHRC